MSTNYIIEVVQFQLCQGIDEKEFLNAAEAMLPDLVKEKGFIDRELLKDIEDQWIDIVHWNSMPEAVEHGKKFFNIPSCRKFVEMIDQSSLKIGLFEQKFHS